MKCRGWSGALSSVEVFRGPIVNFNFELRIGTSLVIGEDTNNGSAVGIAVLGGENVFGVQRIGPQRYMTM